MNKPILGCKLNVKHVMYDNLYGQCHTYKLAHIYDLIIKPLFFCFHLSPDHINRVVILFSWNIGNHYIWQYGENCLLKS